MSEYREFTGKSVEEALKLAREAFGAGLDDLDFEILTPGSRGVLGMGAEPARIVAAPRAPRPRSRRRPPALTTTDRARIARPAVTTGRVTIGRVTIGPGMTGPARIDRPAATTDRPGAMTDRETTGPVATAPRDATTGSVLRPVAVPRISPRRRPPRSRPPEARSRPSERISRRPRHRPRRSPPARRSSSS
jgi:spoIIIJ-associated protein